MAKHPSRRSRRRFLLLAMPVVLLLGILWGNHVLQIHRVSLSFPDLPEGFENCRIVHLSDFHGKTFGRDNRRLLHAVREAAPDYIFLTGDLVDAQTEAPAEYAAQIGSDLCAIAPTYYVTGNHEWSSTRTAEAVKAALSSCGVTVLTNESVLLERGGDSMALAGIEDPNGYAGQKTPAEVVLELYEAYGDPFWMLLVHRNTLFNGNFCRFGADLTLCGHAHGGIWRLPFTDGLVDPTMDWLPSFTSGLYHCTDEGCPGAEVFVSRGLGNSPTWAFRLFNRPEVAVLTLNKG